jgi:hypothetical protein
MNKVAVQVILSGSPFLRRILCPLLVPFVLLFGLGILDPSKRLFFFSGFTIFLSLFLTLLNPYRFWWATRVFTAWIGYGCGEFLGYVVEHPPSWGSGWDHVVMAWLHPITLFLLVGFPCIGYTLTGHFPGLSQMRSFLNKKKINGESTWESE